MLPALPSCQPEHIHGEGGEGLTKVAGHRKLRQAMHFGHTPYSIAGYHKVLVPFLHHSVLSFYLSSLYSFLSLSLPLPSLPLSLCLPSLHPTPLILIIPLSLLPFSNLFKIKDFTV